jgi:hypothetical protein
VLWNQKKIANRLNERTRLESCLRKDSRKGLARKELIGPMDSEEKIENRKRQVTCVKRKPKRLSRKSLNEVVLGSKIALIPYRNKKLWLIHWK